MSHKPNSNIISDFFESQFIYKKLLSPFGFILLALMALGISYFVYVTDGYGAYIILIASLGIPILFFCLQQIEFGILLLFTVSFFILGILRFIDLPLGTLIDGLVFILLLATLWRMLLTRDWRVFTEFVGILILAWIIYNIIQVVNPESTSKLAWVYSIRGMAVILLLYYVAAYSIKSASFVYIFTEIWIFLALMLSIYGLFQEFNGLLPFEDQWVRATEERFLLFYNWGRFRKFSFFSDPTTFGITAAYSGILCIALALNSPGALRKCYLFLCSGIMLLSMVFSGTRTAYALLPVAIIFLALFTMKRNIIIICTVLLTIGAGIILSPIQSLGPLNANNLERIRSAFLFQEDPSFNVRLKNQAFIQPYIQKHPIGAGLGSCGVWAKKFTPDSLLANFPPDSGFVKIAVELGWIGLIIYCALLFFFMKKGLYNYYFKITDPKLKAYQAAFLTVLYSIIVANYAQETITMYPTSIITYIVMAVIVNSDRYKT